MYLIIVKYPHSIFLYIYFRGHLKTFVHTVHLLQKLKDLGPLPVADTMTKLLQTEGGQGQPTSLVGSKHISCWGFEDMLSSVEKEGGIASTAQATQGASPAPGSGGGGSATTSGGGSGPGGNERGKLNAIVRLKSNLKDLSIFENSNPELLEYTCTTFSINMMKHINLLRK